jgi:hypothetical protein
MRARSFIFASYYILLISSLTYTSYELLYFDLEESKPCSSSAFKFSNAILKPNLLAAFPIADTFFFFLEALSS